MAVELSIDHKPTCLDEKLRIKKAGGVVVNGRVNGNLAIARALGMCITSTLDAFLFGLSGRLLANLAHAVLGGILYSRR